MSKPALTDQTEKELLERIAISSREIEKGVSFIKTVILIAIVLTIVATIIALVLFESQ